METSMLYANQDGSSIQVFEIGTNRSLTNLTWNGKGESEWGRNIYTYNVCYTFTEWETVCIMSAVRIECIIVCVLLIWDACVSKNVNLKTYGIAVEISKNSWQTNIYFCWVLKQKVRNLCEITSGGKQITTFISFLWIHRAQLRRQIIFY